MKTPQAKPVGFGNLKHGETLTLRPGTYGLINDLSVLHDHQSGNAEDLELVGKIRLLVNIYLADLHIGAVLGNVVQNRCQHPAGPAPGSPEVQKHRLAAV